MSRHVSKAERDAMRRWLGNWKVVNQVQDDLIRNAPPDDPAASLERGLSLIDFARRLAGQSSDGDSRRDTEAESVRQTWMRLRAAYGR
jgi:hypothetical protein